MSSLEYHRIHGFTDERYGTGNPAGVFVIPTGGPSPSFEVRRQLATETGLPNCAFITHLPQPDDKDHKTTYGIDFYSQTTQIPLCGHACLCSVAVLVQQHNIRTRIEFITARGATISAQQEDDGRFTIDFPAGAEGVQKSRLEDSYGKTVLTAVLKSEATLEEDDILSIVKTIRGPIVELKTSVELKALRPDVSGFPAISDQMVMLTQVAPEGADSCIRSRVFCPAIGSDEDPVCGSAHTSIVPYFLSSSAAKARLRPKSKTLIARHDSPRGGYIEATWNEEGGRMKLTGSTVTVMSGVVFL